MTTPNRTALLSKIQKVLKKHFKPVLPPKDPPVLESMLFGSCLENSRPATAATVFEILKNSFFDWNEVRVSTVTELAETMHALTNPTAAATHLKGVLQSVFESEYSFELEALKKQNLGAAIKRLQKFEGATPFNVAYTVQTSLGGHSIPLDSGTLGALVVVGLISEAEARSSNVPGMERAISKSKGREFGSLLHQMGAEFAANPYSSQVRDLLLSISPDAKDRLPKRSAKKPVEPPAPPPVDGKKKTGKQKEPIKEPAKVVEKGKEKAHTAPKNQSAPKKPVPVKKSTVPAKKKVLTQTKTAHKALSKRKPR